MHKQHRVEISKGLFGDRHKRGGRAVDERGDTATLCLAFNLFFPPRNSPLNHGYCI